MRIFVLQHEHTLGEHDDVKFIGVYSSRINAEEAVLRLCSQPGFDRTQEGFSIVECEVDKDHWTEGFVTV